MRTEMCKLCGKEFHVRYGNQRYCSPECRVHGDRIAARRRRNRQKRVSPALSMQEMLDIMEKMSEEQGRVVQYGEVQAMLLTGRLER